MLPRKNSYKAKQWAVFVAEDSNANIETIQSNNLLVLGLIFNLKILGAVRTINHYFSHN